MVDKCRWCELIHGPICPTVKAIEYYDDGVTVKRVEFKTAADYAIPGIAPWPAPLPTPAPTTWPPPTWTSLVTLWSTGIQPGANAAAAPITSMVFRDPHTACGSGCPH